MKVDSDTPSASSSILRRWGSDQDYSLLFASSSETRETVRRVWNLNTVTAGEGIPTKSSGQKTLEERLYDALAAVKIYTAQVAMHMDREWRLKLFAQLDSLLDVDEWDERDVPLRQASFATFLKLMFLLKPGIRPGLGLAAGGNLIAAWTGSEGNLTVEFSPRDRVRWMVSRRINGDLERGAGEGAYDRLLTNLQPYDPAHWFGARVEGQSS